LGRADELKLLSAPKSRARNGYISQHLQRFVRKYIKEKFFKIKGFKKSLNTKQGTFYPNFQLSFI
jgi:hypothetical protein